MVVHCVIITFEVISYDSQWSFDVNNSAGDEKHQGARLTELSLQGQDVAS